MSAQSAQYNTGDSSTSPSQLHGHHGTGTSAISIVYPTASGSAGFSYQSIFSSQTLSIKYSLSPTSTPPGEAPEQPEETPSPDEQGTPTPEPTPVPTPTPTPGVSTPLAQPEVPIYTPPVSSVPPLPAYPVVTPSAAPTPSVNPGIPTLGSPGMPVPGQPGRPTCGQAGMEYCGGTGAPAPYPSATGTGDPWGSHAGPNITPEASSFGTGYPGTGVYGMSTTMTTYVKPTPTPMDPLSYGEDGEGEGPSSEKRSFWKRLEEEIKEALGYGGGRTEMSP